MSWTRNQLGIADEATYGTAPASGYKGYAVTSETFTPEIVELTHQGFRRQRQGIRASEYAQIFVGGTGEFAIPVPVDKNDALFKELLGAHTAFSGNAWTEKSNETGPSTGRTIIVKRGLDNDGTNVEQAVYTGCIPTDWSLEASVGGFAELSTSWWWQKQEIGGSSKTVGAVPDARPFRWNDITVTYDGDAVPGVTGFSFEASLGMDTGRAYLDGVTARSKPLRSDIPSYSGSLEMVYNSDAKDLFSAWRNGSVKTIVVKLSASDYISSGTNPSSLTLTLKSCRFTGDSPVAAPDAYTTISLPFMVLEPASGDVVNLAAAVKAAA